MSRTVRRLGRVLFGLAGAGSALFVHLLPPPAPLGGDALPGSAPAAVASPGSAVASPGRADRPLVALPATRPHGAGSTDPAAPAVLATDGSASHPPAPGARRR